MECASGLPYARKILVHVWRCDRIWKGERICSSSVTLDFMPLRVPDGGYTFTEGEEESHYGGSFVRMRYVRQHW